MTEIVVMGLKTCDTCRKAVRALTGAGHTARLRDVRAEPLDDNEIARLLSAFGEALVNRRSTTWRDLPPDERAASPEALLAIHPTLMKRPVIETADGLHLGWGADVQAAVL